MSLEHKKGSNQLDREGEKKKKKERKVYGSNINEIISGIHF